MPQSCIISPKLILQMHSRKIQVTAVQDTYIRREQAPNMVNYRVHMAPFSCCAVCSTVTQCRQTPPPPHSLHITGPAQLPRVDKPHPTSVTGTRPAVTGCTRKEVAQVVLNGSSVSNKYDCKFSQDTLNGDIIENRFPVIELVYNLRANRFKPT